MPVLAPVMKTSFESIVSSLSHKEFKRTKIAELRACCFLREKLGALFSE
jgi:hypothetical protein